MNNEIIAKLVKLEEEVQQLTANALQKREDFAKSTHVRCHEIENQLQKQYDEKLKNETSSIIQENKNKIEALKNEKVSKTAMLEKNYNDNRKTWEEEIFNFVIGG